MTLELTTFNEETELCNGVMRATKPVETPQPESPDGSGYDTESNHKCYYRHGDEYITAAKVNDTGWSVWRYSADDGEPIPLKRLGDGLDAQAAKRLALTTAVNRSGK